jgi:hypothetical protein
MDSSSVCESIKKNLIELNSKDYPEEIINDMYKIYVPEYMIEKAKKPFFKTMLFINNIVLKNVVLVEN